MVIFTIKLSKAKKEAVTNKQLRIGDKWKGPGKRLDLF